MKARRFPDASITMPSDAEIKAEKTLQIGSKSPADVASGLVVPRLQFIPVHAKSAKISPELAKWHQDNHRALEDWRERFNIMLNRSATENRASVNSELDNLQKQVDRFNTMFPPPP